MKKILVAYDGGEHGARALTTAIELAGALKLPVGVISVVPVRAGRAPMDPWDDREVHRSELAEAKRVLLEAGIEPELIEPYGEPARTIERIAAERGYDTIVVGPRGLGAMASFFQGSVSEHVATHAEGTVIVAR